jgi:hypothetical protein
MFLYVFVMIAMSVGATTLSFQFVYNKLALQRITIYDARGFYMVAMVFVTFVLTSLAYFWGDSRFGSISTSVSGSVIGVLVTLIGCLVGLGYGLTKLKEVDSSK